MPVVGQCSIAESKASCVRSSASGTSRSIRDRLVISRGCSMRQTATIMRWVSAAVIAADRACVAPGSCVGARVDLAHAIPMRHRIGANLTGSFPTRHMLPVQLHELDRQCESLFLVPQLENRVAADHLLRLDERPIDDAE